MITEDAFYVAMINAQPGNLINAGKVFATMAPNEPLEWFVTDRVENGETTIVSLTLLFMGVAFRKIQLALTDGKYRITGVGS